MNVVQLDCSKPTGKESLQVANVVTMSSREIAELVESRHDSVRRTVERLAEKGIIQLPPLVEVKNHLGQMVSEYRIAKRDSYVVVAQLSPEFTARLVDRWQELESGAMALPDFGNPILAARAWADQLERADGAEQALQAAAPALVAHEILIEAEGSLCITDAAKALQMRPKALFAWLRHHRWIFRRNGGVWLGYSAMLIAGFLEHKVTTISRSSGVAKVAEQVRVTPKGLAKLAYVLDLEEEA